MDQLPWVGKRELIVCCCLPVIMWFLFGKVSSSSGCLAWDGLRYLIVALTEPSKIIIWKAQGVPQ